MDKAPTQKPVLPNHDDEPAIPSLATNPVKRPKREGEKRLSVAITGERYTQLRLYAATTEQTHQTILEQALYKYLDDLGANMRIKESKT
jgi:hypothetical protein